MSKQNNIYIYIIDVINEDLTNIVFDHFQLWHKTITRIPTKPYR